MSWLLHGIPHALCCGSFGFSGYTGVADTRLHVAWKHNDPQVKPAVFQDPQVKTAVFEYPQVKPAVFEYPKVKPAVFKHWHADGYFMESRMPCAAVRSGFQATRAWRTLACV